MTLTHTLACLFCLMLSSVVAFAADGRTRLKPVPFTRVTIEDDFWRPRLETNRTETLPHNLALCEETGRISNFAKAGKLMDGKFEGKYYNDSDVYKVLEGAAYTLAQHRDPDLEATIDAIIDKIASAQQDDGYINSYYTLVEPDKRWTNLRDMHELYCAGHMFEAAVAYARATGKTKLLDVSRRMADHIDRTFGPDKRWGEPGHEEIELALIKLYHETGEERYRDLAKYFVDARGTQQYEGDEYPAYRQAHIPVREQSDVVGHAVRAMYLYAGVADVAAETGDVSLIDTMERIWQSVALRKMYITGAIGSRHGGEAFGDDYELPNASGYGETCASIGMILWNHRLFLLHGQRRFADHVERVLYNGMLVGVSLDGDKFFYVNPLESDGGHHRQPWYSTACCPSNVVRFLPSLAGYMYATSEDAIWANLYIAGAATVDWNGADFKLRQETRYPWAGDVKITVEPAKPTDVAIKLRVPQWCTSASVRVNGERILSPDVKDGYFVLRRTWKPGDVIDLDLPMPVVRMRAHPKVINNLGRVALQRGPIVYCLEAVDNDGKAKDLALPRDAELHAEWREDLLNGVVQIKAEGYRPGKRDNADALYAPPVPPRSATLTAVPYYAWDNRDAGEMAVWIPETPSLAERE